jgi:hypothetical protein
MPFVLIVIGLALVVAGVQGNEAQLMQLIKADFAGNGTFKGSYFAWVVAIGVVGGLGYIQKIRPIANAFLVLVILVLFLSNRGFFAQFNNALQTAVSNAGSSSTSSTSTTNTGNATSMINSLPSILSSLGTNSTQANEGASEVNQSLDSASNFDLSNFA